MATEYARRKAAQAWCRAETEKREMDVDLAEAFAEIIDEIWGKPWLGFATTRELLDEVAARVDLDYRTVDS